MKAIKPCPACGGTEFDIDIYHAGNGYQAFVICGACDDVGEPQGPVSNICSTEDEAESDAVRAWNGLASKKAEHGLESKAR